MDSCDVRSRGAMIVILSVKQFVEGVNFTFSYALRQRRIVDVALLFAGIESRLVRRIERCIFPVARGQIRIGKKRDTEGDEIGLSARNYGMAGMSIVTAVHDHR